MNKMVPQLLTETMHRWLLSLNISVPREFIEQRLSAHPYCPSSLSIVDVLNELGIESKVEYIDRDQLTQINAPFLACVNKLGFVLVKDIRNAEKQRKAWLLQWTGIVVTVKKPNQIVKSPFLLAIETGKRKWQLKRALLVACFTLLSVMGIMLDQCVQRIPFFVFSFGGFYLSMKSVMGKTLAYDNHINFYKLFLSRPDKEHIPPQSLTRFSFQVIDGCIAFFGGALLLQFFLFITSGEMINSVQSMLFLASLSGLPFVVVSVYYQWQINNQWNWQWLGMGMCVVGIAFTCTMMGFQDSLSPTPFLLGSFIFFSIPGITWLMARPVLEHKRQLEQSSHYLAMLRHSAATLNELIEGQSLAEFVLRNTEQRPIDHKSLCRFAVITPPHVINRFLLSNRNFQHPTRPSN